MRKAARAILLIAPMVSVIFCNFPQEPAQVNRATRGMQPIPGGTFFMGSADTIDTGARPIHEVTVDGFYMDSTEVTQMAYADYMGFNPTTFPTFRYEFYPVDSLTWYDAVLFANERSKREHIDTVYSYSKADMKITLSNIGTIESIRCTSMTNLKIGYSKKGYRLPTEAEWEYACRAGTTTVNYWGDNLEEDTISKYAWFDPNASWHVNTVAWKWPNAWGLYDMIGNVWEWCNDWYQEGYSPDPAVNPIGPTTGTERVMRGGAQNSVIADRSLRSASRAKDRPENYRSNRGFRLVLPK